MKLKFWGTRGSIPSPGASTLRYGGNTSCVELTTSAGTLLILDCGTGLRGLGEELMARGTQPIHGYILITHTHWDHIQGLPFFQPLFVKGNEWDIYAPRGFERSLRETLAGQMQYSYFPVTLAELGSNIRYHELVEGDFTVNDVKIQAQYLNHPALTLGYRIQVDDITMVYSTDHEPHTYAAAVQGDINKQELPHVQFLSGADLVIHDAQYIAKEYDAKKGWGHSTIEYAVDVCNAAGVKRLALTHHEPNRSDLELDAIVTKMRKRLKEVGSKMEVFAAAENQIIELGSLKETTLQVPLQSAENSSFNPRNLDKSVLVGISDPKTASHVMEAVNVNAVHGDLNDSEEAILKAIEKTKPSLVILEDNPPYFDGAKIVQELAQKSGKKGDFPIIMVANREEDVGTHISDGVDEWLIKPFSILYARSRVQSWLLRIPIRWLRPPLPSDEQQRLDTLHRLKLLDSPSEENFDRLTRLAVALFDTTIALITLIDAERQWFKSCYGLKDIKETDRDISFCAHVIVKREPIVVNDTFEDDRFADNPFVTGYPHIRFYAGYPLILSNGVCIGTFCIADSHPRGLNEKDLKLLKDFADLVVREIEKK